METIVGPNLLAIVGPDEVAGGEHARNQMVFLDDSVAPYFGDESLVVAAGHKSIFGGPQDATPKRGVVE